MKNFFGLLFFLTIPVIGFSQIKTLDRSFKSGGFSNKRNDSLPSGEINVTLSGKTKYTDYKIISFKKDTSYVDTTLTLQKHYKFNFRRKDNFGLLPFHNQGQTFTSLTYDFSESSQFPDIGFRGKHFNFMRTEDINYYQVPTPTTEILYRTGMEQGQVLDALFTVNFNKRLNASIAYRGLRSLGQYRRSLASTGNFSTTVSYTTPKNQYSIRTHIATQDFFNEESGGLTTVALDNFSNGDANFDDRARLDVNLSDAENNLETFRMYVDHNFQLFSSKDSTNQKNFSNLKLGHELTIENKDYNFTESSLNNDFFGDAYTTTGNTNETTKYSLTNNQAYLEFNSKYILGRFKAKANYTNVSYGYDELINLSSGIDNIKLQGNAIGIGAEWKGAIGNFAVNADAMVTPGNGHLAGNHLYGEALYKKDSVFTLKGRLQLSSKAPDFTYQLFQSRYNAYNWNNNFENIGTRNLGFDFNSKWGNASLDFTNIDDFVYFNEDAQPVQYNNGVTYLKVKVQKEFKFFKNFAFDNSILYQNVSSGSEVFRVPELVSRNTLYYTGEWFRGKPLMVQIGGTLNYFSKYKMNAYDPLLAGFKLQNNREIGYPSIDLFFNARVRRTRIFFKIDNVTSNFTSNFYYSAPNYPYRDMVIRFGVVWNWFI